MRDWKRSAAGAVVRAIPGRLSVTRESPNAVLVDVAKYVCPTHDCRDEQDGVVLRDDGVHYRDKGAQLIAGWILEQIRAK